MHNCFFVMF